MKCRGLCKSWHGMINFISDVPKYALADRCHQCKIWFPKYCLIKCPCCKNTVRIKRRKYNDMRYITPAKSHEAIVLLIEKALANNWTLLNKDIWKSIKDYELLVKKQNLDNKKVDLTN